jgi:hypothetical protein
MTCAAQEDRTHDGSLEGQSDVIARSLKRAQPPLREVTPSYSIWRTRKRTPFQNFDGDGLGQADICAIRGELLEQAFRALIAAIA